MLDGCVPWPEEAAARWRRLGYWEDRSLWDMLTRSADLYPERTALVAGDQRIRYSELVERALAVATNLAGMGLQPGDRAVLQIHNSPEFVITFFGLIRIGVIPVMALPAHRYTEVEHFVRHSQARAYFIPDKIKGFDYRQMAESVRAACPMLDHVFVVGDPLPGQTSLTATEAAAPGKDALPVLDPGEVALMLLSGGTTALPKLIPRTHNDYVYNARASGEVAGIDQDTVFLAVLPLGHNYSLASPGMLATLSAGGTVVLAPHHGAETVFPIVERERVTLIAAAVPLITAWLGSDVPDRCDLSSLKVVQNGGAQLAPELRRRLRDRFGCIPQEDYGTAEGLINMTRLDDPDELILESSGAPISPGDEIKVLDDNNLEVPDGQLGELLARGPYTICGYYNGPENNAKAFTADGFYRMGDRVQKAGRYVYIKGRKKELINRGGEKISSEEIENLVLKHPKVKGCCVVAMPDRIFGEKACACVVPNEGENLTLMELTDFLLQQQIAKFKLPERLEVMTHFPISPAGKILRRALREIISQKSAHEAGATEEGSISP